LLESPGRPEDGLGVLVAALDEEVLVPPAMEIDAGAAGSQMNMPLEPSGSGEPVLGEENE
jgi:hypothetical protein